MAKELMEIGGFITEGAEIVNHDNSLSGNGTVDSPLGLNETVLWTGTLNTLNSNIECNESLSNFSTIKVYYRIVADSIVQSPTVYEFEPSEMSSSNNISFGAFYLISNDYFGWWLCRLVVTDGYKVKITNVKNSYGQGSNASPSNNYTGTNVGYIYKIVGINRKAQ